MDGSNGRDYDEDTRHRHKDDSADRKREKKDRRHRSGSRDSKRSKKSSKHSRSRGSSSKRKRKSRSRSREERQKKHRSRSRERPHRSSSRSRGRGGRRRRSPSPTRSYSPGYYRRLENQKRLSAGEPKKFWDGFQWVVQQPTASAESASQELRNGDPKVVIGLTSPGSSLQNGPAPIMSAIQYAALSQTRKDRRLYVGNLPPTISIDQLRDFLNAAMEACGGVPEGAKEAVLSVWIGPEAKYSFVEFTTTDCATVALGLNGINCMGFPLKISRPTNYAISMPGPPQVQPGGLLQAMPTEFYNSSLKGTSIPGMQGSQIQPSTQALLAAAMGQAYQMQR